METCRVTPNSNIIDYVCGLPSRGGQLRQRVTTSSPPPPPPPAVTDDDGSLSIVDLGSLPLPAESDPATSEFMSSDSDTTPDVYAGPQVVDNVVIHHYPQTRPLIVPGVNAYSHHQPVPGFTKIVSALPPLIPLINSYQGKAIQDAENLIRQLETRAAASAA